MSTLALDVQSMGAFLWASAPGSIDRVLAEIDRELLAYLGRYTGFGLDEMYSKPISRLRRLADGVNKIIEAENKT